MLKAIFALILLASLSFSLTVVSPVNTEIERGDVIDLGTIGPGQTVFIQIDPIVTTGGINDIGGQYDMAIAEDLPRGWSSTESKLYQNPLQVTITTDPDAPEGNYTAQITVIDEFDGEGLGNVTFSVKVEITYDVMDFDVTPSYIETGPDQPVRFKITITNKGSTSDAFEVKSSGVKRWEYKRHVLVPKQSSRTIEYEIVGAEEEIYKATISVVSLASDNIADEKNVTLSVKPSLLGDYKATNNGVSVFPIFEMPIHALAGLISNLFN
jgi:hypothetical protein